MSSRYRILKLRYNTCTQIIHDLYSSGNIKGAIYGKGNADIIPRAMKVADKYKQKYNVSPPIIEEVRCKSMLCKYLCDVVYTEFYDSNGEVEKVRVED